MNVISVVKPHARSFSFSDIEMKTSIVRLKIHQQSHAHLNYFKTTSFSSRSIEKFSQSHWSNPMLSLFFSDLKMRTSIVQLKIQQQSRTGKLFYSLLHAVLEALRKLARVTGVTQCLVNFFGYKNEDFKSSTEDSAAESITGKLFQTTSSISFKY